MNDTVVTNGSSPAIRVRGARVHNLQNIDVDVPRDRLVVFTGVSGSGKSSLAFDTLVAEGQRRYLESLSIYTRQFFDQLERPDVDLIEGLPPTLSIEQRIGSVQPYSTVATTTQIYDYLRLLYARTGHAHCYQCGSPVSQQSRNAIVDGVLALGAGRKLMLLAPLIRSRKGLHRAVFASICEEGFVRARVDGHVVDASDPPELQKSRLHDIEAVVDRIVLKEGVRARVSESVDLALKHGAGTCLVSYEQEGDWLDIRFSTHFACLECGISFEALEPRTFSFSSPYGACADCGGLGIAVSEQVTDESWGDAAACPACAGSRLGPVARAVTIAGVAIHELTAMTVPDAETVVLQWQQSLDAETASEVFSPQGELIAARIVGDVATRLQFLNRIGLDYLTLDRPIHTLSGGEFQRARLAGCLGSGLTGVCYVLDEPTIGLHARDTGRLTEMLFKLRDRGNSVIVVEHDPDVMRAGDYLIDVGPGAGREGGRIVNTGTPGEIAQAGDTPTGRYLNGTLAVGGGAERRPVDRKQTITLSDVRLHNLKNVTFELPLGVLVCVTGVSGSGKISLVVQSFLPAVKRALAKPDEADARLTGCDQIDRVVEVDQRAIGRTGRSNAATYTGIWNEVRKVFAQTREARLRGYKPGRFSFNTAGGRCEECKGQGSKRVEMDFLPDMFVTCPRCRGARFNRETLQVRFLGKTIADVLGMRIDEAAEVFSSFAKLKLMLDTLADVGLEYLTLGQSALTLSGGESQRVKLASELGKSQQGRTLYLLDEPTTGLHPADIRNLLDVLNRLVSAGHSVLVIEHELDVIGAADWVIDLGPEGGKEGGYIVATGTPQDIAAVTASHTGDALRRYAAGRTSP